MLRSVSSESRTSSSSSSSSSAESDSDSASEKAIDNYNIIEQTWPEAQRPKELKSREVINKMSMQDILAVFSMQDIADRKNKGDLAESFKKDTKPPKKKFREGYDDRNRNLHPASFLRLPIRDFEKYWHKTPTKREHIYKNFPMEFIGVANVASDVTVQNLHDKKNVLALKMFMADNVQVGSKPRVNHTAPDGSAKTDFDWVTPTSLVQVQEAVANYALLFHSIWPHDPTPLILQKVLCKYRWFSSVDNTQARVKFLCGFINAVMRINAAKATNRDCILSFEGQCKIAASTLQNNGYNPAVPFDVAKPSTSQTNQRAPAKPAGGRGKQDKVKAEWQGHGLCFDWNSTSGGICKNGIPNTELCKDAKGRTFAHRCNVGTGRGMWCLQTHRRKDHK